jgi:plasmid stabilization system protein ParE
MALKIVFNKRADNKLDKILDYLTKEWSLKVVNEYIENLYNTLDNLAEFPEIGLKIDEERNIRALLVTKHTRLYYRVDKNRLIILNFIDTRKKQAG